MTTLISGKIVATSTCSEFVRIINFSNQGDRLDNFSLHCSFSESIILRASPHLLTRPPYLARGLLAHVVALRFQNSIFFLKLKKDKTIKPEKRGIFTSAYFLKSPVVIPFLPRKGKG